MYGNGYAEKDQHANIADSFACEPTMRDSNNCQIGDHPPCDEERIAAIVTSVHPSNVLLHRYT